MAIPELTNAQRKEALAKAKAARETRAEAKRRLAAGEISIGELLDSDDPAIGRMKVSELLRAVYGVGKARADAALRKMRIADTRRLAGLGPRQRAELIEFVEQREARHAE